MTKTKEKTLEHVRETIRALALTKKVPGIPNVIIERFQKPVNDSSRRMNGLLVRIFNDSELHAAIRAYGEKIPFAHYRTDDSCYTGFFNLELDPEKRMILVRRELQYMADHNDETELKNYDLFQTDGRLFYVQRKFEGEVGKQRGYNEAVLASNDMTGHEFSTNFNRKKAPTPNRILKSLTNAVDHLVLCKIAPSFKGLGFPNK